MNNHKPGYIIFSISHSTNPFNRAQVEGVMNSVGCQYKRMMGGWRGVGEHCWLVTARVFEELRQNPLFKAHIAHEESFMLVSECKHMYASIVPNNPHENPYSVGRLVEVDYATVQQIADAGGGWTYDPETDVYYTTIQRHTGKPHNSRSLSSVLDRLAARHHPEPVHIFGHCLAAIRAGANQRTIPVHVFGH